MKKLFLVLAAVLFLFGNVGSSSAGPVYNCTGIMVNEFFSGLAGYPMNELTDPPILVLTFADGFVPTAGGTFTDADVAAANFANGAMLWEAGQPVNGTFNAADANVIDLFDWTTPLGFMHLDADGILYADGNPGVPEVTTDNMFVGEGAPPPEFDGTGIQITGTSSNITMNVMVGDTVEFSVDAIEKDGAPMEYRFFTRAGYGEAEWGGNKWTIVQQYSDNNTVMHTFDTVGIYFLAGHVIHPGDTWVFGYPQSGIVVEVWPAQ